MKRKFPFFSLILPLGLFGQSVVVVPNTENYNQNGIVYNNSLFFSKDNKLFRFDGVTVVNLPNPSDNGQPIDGKLTGTMIIYNNKLCYNYDYRYLYSTAPLQYRNKDYIITYDGSTQTAFWNSDAGYEGGISIDDNGRENEPILYNNKLVFRGSYYGVINLYTFDGQTIVKINNENNFNNLVNNLMLGSHALVYNNVLYFAYKGDSSFMGFGKFDGTSITRITNYNKEYRGAIFTIDNKLYFKMGFFDAPSSYNIGNYDPVTNVLSKVPGPSIFNSDGSRPLIYNSQAYIATMGSKFAIFDGITINEVANLNINDKGVDGRRILFGGDIYFPYKNSNDIRLLGKYSGTNISLTSNISPSDKGIGNSLAEFNGELYFTYTTSAVSPNVARTYLAKYDGQNITVMPNPDNGEGVQDSKFVVYGNDLYFPYKNASGIIVLAKYGTTVLGTSETAKNVDISIFKDNDGFSIISKTKEIDKIDVIDASGRLISNAKVNAKEHYFEISGHGIYIIKVILKDGTISALKVKN